MFGQKNMFLVNSCIVCIGTGIVWFGTLEKAWWIIMIGYIFMGLGSEVLLVG